MIRLCNWVGEVVLSLPALERLAAAGVPLQLFGKVWAPSLLEATGWQVDVHADRLGAAIGQLRPFRGNRSVLMVNSFRSALEMRMAGLSATGFAKEGRSPLLGQPVQREGFAHAAHAYWKLAQACLGTHEPFPEAVQWQPSERQKSVASQLLAAQGLTPGRYVVLCPFSGADDQGGKKRWSGYPELCRRLLRAGIGVLVGTGSPSEAALVESVAPGAITFSASGLGLGVHGALMQSALCVVANETGPGHLAGFAGARLLSIYGPLGHRDWKPLGPHVSMMWPNGGWPSVDLLFDNICEPGSQGSDLHS